MCISVFMARLPPLQGTAFLYLPPSPFIFSSLQPHSDFLPFGNAMLVLELLIQLSDGRLNAYIIKMSSILFGSFQL